MAKLGPIEIKVPKLPGRARAITLWPFILYRDPPELRDECLRVHERHHWDEALRWGVLPWYAAYGAQAVWTRLVRGEQDPRAHPMERPAYEAQDECKEKE